MQRPLLPKIFEKPKANKVSTITTLLALLYQTLTPDTLYEKRYDI